MCLYPRLIKNRKYEANKKNGGVIPAINDKRTLAVPVGCGKCMECMKKKGREWQVRLLEDIRHNKNGIFVTLTFSNESIKEISEKYIEKTIKGYDRDNAIAKKGVRLFLEKWRKKFGKSARHWLVTELGHEGTENIHLHGIIWTDHKREDIEERWGHGIVWTNDVKKGYVNEQTVNYITKYISKQDLEHKYYKPIVLTSQGIGKGYLERMDSQSNRYRKGNTKETYTTRTRHEIGLPIYLRNKIYTEEEREKLWIEKLNKAIRYVDGKMVDMKKYPMEYWNRLKKAREKSDRLGYGNNRKTWSREQYENERRDLLFEKRVTASSERAEGSATTQYFENSKEEFPNSANVVKPLISDITKELEDFWDDSDYVPF